MEDPAHSVSPVAPRVSESKSSFRLALPARPSEARRPAPLPEASGLLSPRLPSCLRSHSIDSLSSSTSSWSSDSQPPAPVPFLDSSFLIHHVPPQPPVSSLHHTQRGDPALHLDPSSSVNTIFALQSTVSEDLEASPHFSHTVKHPDSLASVYYTAPSPAALSSPDGTRAQGTFQQKEMKSKTPNNLQKNSHPKIFGDHVQVQLLQIFWGLPSLHSESLLSSVLISATCSIALVYFNNHNTNGLSVQIQEKEFQLLSHPVTFPIPELEPQTLPQPQLQISPPSPLLIKPSGESVPRPHNEAHSPTQEDISHLEWHTLQKQLEGLWGIPATEQKSQKSFCPPAPTFPKHHQCYKAQTPVSIRTGNFPLSEDVSKSLERHLKKRLIQQRWGLNRRIHESSALMEPPKESPEPAVSKSANGLSWIPKYKQRCSVHDSLRERGFYEQSLESAHCMKDVKKAQPQISGTAQAGHPAGNPDGNHIRPGVWRNSGY
ncbi:PREDICTED: spermatogenesis-associated protein 31D1-like [Elephantulus edwardii]|uniref:spermatogenesis-associated protein 31D1-like n=1 Tax=Elephantulus edwardii TaxID=28737 RepID=UPI0003F062CA|nr:PREDICTED: spermatogenesis-associated protein 31D1-like [Elephantulus edwardii]